jgi:hypothetical protein
MRTLLIIFTGLLLLTTVSAQKTKLPLYPAAALQEDIRLLRRTLETHHPSLYWYTPKDSMDLLFDQTLASITDSMDEVAFKNKVAYIISRIRCGHSTVRFSKSFTRKAATRVYPAFPLELKVWGDTMVVLNQLRHSKDSLLPRGSVVNTINGKTPRQLLDTFFAFISSDGYAYHYKDLVVSSNFGAWYKTVLGLDTAYRVSITDTAGKQSEILLHNFDPVTDTAWRRQLPRRDVITPALTKRQLRKLQKEQERNFRIDTASSTAILRISTFSGSGLRGFYRRSFRKMHAMGIQHLVIDLRNNGGGKISNSTLLGKYIFDHPFRLADSVFTVNRSLRNSAAIHPFLPYWLEMQFSAVKTGDQRFHLRGLEQKTYDPKTRHHFNGDIYLIQGGLSFSATSILLAGLKGQHNITLVGEETGGGYYGNSAVHLPTIRMPQSGLRVSLPLYRVVMDAQRPKGRGVMPDVEAPATIDAIRMGIDPKMEKVRQLINGHSSVNRQ